ncbi:MAG: BTAD domain-containing putative transcriptional regulator [Trueperaceae bacterium]
MLYVFYPDVPESAARRNLRQILSSLRRAPFSQGLHSDPQRVRMTVPTDVKEFLAALTVQDVVRASELFGGTLLEGATGVDAHEFQSWLEAQRSELLSGWRDLVLTHAATLEPARAGEALRTLLRYDSLDEDVLQAYMRVSHAAGQTTAALRAFRAFEHNLLSEMGLEPATDTLELAAQLAAQRGTSDLGTAAISVVPSRQGSQPVAATQPELPWVAARGAGTAFVGRRDETTAIAALLHEPDCRLLTLLAAGGTGKSRLAWEVANQQRAEFGGGCYFVELDSLTSESAVPATIAAALGIAAEDRVRPLKPVVAAIGNRHVLITLDNFEHLLGGATLCSELLAGCPNLKLLVTSRERLNVLEEWVLPLEGLSMPPEGATDTEALATDSVALFVKRATQVRHDFSMSHADVTAIRRICRLVEGSPLALEIAATWVRALSCEQILAGLERSIDFLQRPTRNVPERQRSVRATLEYSWGLLSPEEQQDLRKLAVFLGGFMPEAAADVANVQLAGLTALVDKSLLRTALGGRFDRHPLLYQFTREKLAEEPALQKELEELHGRYYLRLLRDNYGGLETKDHQEALALFEDEHANVIAAWRWAVATTRVDELRESTWALDSVLTFRVPEGRAMIAEAIAGLDEGNPTHRSALAYLLIQQGHFIYLLHGASPEHDASIERGLRLFRQLGEPVGLMRGLIGLGVSRESKNDLQGARDIFLEGLELARVHGTPRDVSLYLSNLLNVERELSEPAAFVALCDAATEELTALGNTVVPARIVFGLGTYLLQHGDAEAGQALAEEGLEQLRQVGDRRFIPFGWLALQAAQRGDHQEAESLAQEGYAVVMEAGDRFDEVVLLQVLGQVAHLRGERELAAQRLSEALRAAVAISHGGLLVDTLLQLAEVLATAGDLEQAATWLGFVRVQEGLTRRHLQKVEAQVKDVRRRLEEEALASSFERGGRLTLESVVGELVA